jgi:hypothetical protein
MKFSKTCIIHFFEKKIILDKIVKIGQLQMGVETREPIMISGFFRLKHSVTIAEQKKLHMESFCRGLSSLKIPKGPSIHPLKFSVPRYFISSLLV